MIKTTLGEEYLQTNKVEVEIDFDAFFDEYAIVSYSGYQNEKNLPYDKLSSFPVLSVAGIYGMNTFNKEGKKFFVLSKRTDAEQVKKGLAPYQSLLIKDDFLDEYDEQTQKRIVLSLALNSLSTNNDEGLFCNNAELIVCDSLNFLSKKKCLELSEDAAEADKLVCLKIEFNKYLNLCAKTNTFTHPKSEKELRYYQNCVFVKGDFIKGKTWMGSKIQKVNVNSTNFKELAANLENVFIKKSQENYTHNVVPYLPFDKERYSHGKLFVLTEIYDMINKKFKGMIHITFKKYEVIDYSENNTGKNMEALMKEYFHNKSLCFQNPVGTSLSEETISQLKRLFDAFTEGGLSYVKKKGDFVIKLCEEIPQNKKMKEKMKREGDNTYSHHLDEVPSQHYVFQPNRKIKVDKFVKAKARRVLMELMVKDCNYRKVMPVQYVDVLNGWEFYRFIDIKGFVYGLSMQVLPDGTIFYKPYGFDKESEMRYEDFCLQVLRTDNMGLLKGSKEHLVLKKGDNSYIIVNTEEVPVLDADLYDDTFLQISRNEGEIKKIGQVKNKAYYKKFFSGYVGLHVFWDSDFLGEEKGSLAYISGGDKNMKILDDFIIDKVPRTKRIMCLEIRDMPSREAEMMSIIDMLKYGFGKWNIAMSYPLPFKFMQEYLDLLCCSKKKCHWENLKGEMTTKKDK